MPAGKTPKTDAPTVAVLPEQTRGEALLEQVISLTGIPSQAIQRELKAILDKKNIDLNHLTLDQLRTVVASYLREIMGGLLERSGHRKPDSNH